MKLWELLRRHAERHGPERRLHLPAHRGGGGVPELVACFGDYVRLDLTEVGELDDLAQPEGILKAAQEEAARLYEARRAFFLSGGSSQGLAAALYAALRPGDLVLLPQNCHRSALAGLAITGARPVFYPVGWEARYGVFTRPDLDRLELFARSTGARAAVLVYPSYEGVAFPLAEAVGRLRRAGTRTIVDAAHGSHFGLPGLPPHPARARADYTVLGLHKSGGALTPGAVLLVEDDEETARVREGLLLFGSSSPSYPVLASIALALDGLTHRGAERVRRSIAAAAHLTGPAVFAPPPPADPTRRLIRLDGAPRFAEKLNRRFGILPEYVSAHQILFLFGLDFPPEAVEPWAAAIAELPAASEDLPAPPMGEGVLSPRDALLRPRTSVALEDAVGRVAAAIVAPSPPGVPVLWPGQRVTEAHVAWLADAAAGGQVLLGLEEGRVAVVA